MLTEQSQFRYGLDILIYYFLYNIFFQNNKAKSYLGFGSLYLSAIHIILLSESLYHHAFTTLCMIYHIVLHIVGEL